MRLRNLNFITWCTNHPEDHDAKWCRELYPFNIFQNIDFGESQLNVQQKVEFNRSNYSIEILNIELQENRKYRTTFNFYTLPKSKTQAWKNRVWHTTFQIIYTQEGDFITVFTKKEDPSKDLVARFMKGNFEKIELNKSIPISELLLKTLLLHISEENFPNGQHYKVFNFLKSGIRELPPIKEFKPNKLEFAPIYSIDRKIWICYAFNEEKAHRIAFLNANQCERIIVVYCNPTYTRHQRCKYPGTEILSIYEYTAMVSELLRLKFESQIKFLQNHLNTSSSIEINDLLNEIKFPSKEIYEIEKSDLMEALGVMKIIPKNKMELFYSLAAFNLINAWIARKKNKTTIAKKDEKLFKNMFYFKTYLSNTLTFIISQQHLNAKIFIDNEFVIIEILEFQFSFKSVPMNNTLKAFIVDIQNKEIVWKGKKLQPISPLILQYARQLKKSRLCDIM